MVAAPEILICPIDGCDRVDPFKNNVGLGNHLRIVHPSTEPVAFGRKDGQVDIDLAKFPEAKLPEAVAGGFWRSLLTFTTAGVIGVFGLLTFLVMPTNPTQAGGLLIAGPVLALALWWVTESRKLAKVAVITNPPDQDGRVRVTFQWWPADLVKLLPQEARRLSGRGSVYVIDRTGDKPVAFTPFTVQPPEFAIPVRGAMANQQIDNEQLNRVHRKGIRPEVVEQAFALLVIGGLILANIVVMGHLLEFLDQ